MVAFSAEVAAVKAVRTGFTVMALQTRKGQQGGWICALAHSGRQEFEMEGSTCCWDVQLPMYSSSSMGVTLLIPNAPLSAKACRAPTMNPGPCG